MMANLNEQREINALLIQRLEKLESLLQKKEN